MMRTADFGTPWRRPEATGGGPDRASRPSSRRRMQKRDSWTTRSTTRRRSCNSFQNASSSSSCAVFESSSAIFGMHSPSAGRAGRGSRTTRVLPLDMQASTGPSRLKSGVHLVVGTAIRLRANAYFRLRAHRLLQQICARASAWACYGDGLAASLLEVNGARSTTSVGARSPAKITSSKPPIKPKFLRNCQKCSRAWLLSLWVQKSG
jgi:hypothetical protein